MKTGRKWRTRRTPDFNRLRAALAGPGADTRAWIAVGRVEDDPDAVRWEDGVGWLADVVIMSGPLATTGEVTCRVMCPFGGDDAINTAPVRSGCVVVVALPDGEANGSPVVLGYLHNTEDCAAASTVNELPIDEAAAADNVLVKTPASLEAEYGPTVRVQAKEQMALVAPRVDIAPDDVRGPSGEPFVRGDDYGDALGDFLSALNTYVTQTTAAATALALQPPTTPLTGAAGAAYQTALSTAAGTFAQAISAFVTSIAPAPAGWKSTKIFGE